MNAVLFASAMAAAVSLLLTLVTDLSVLRVSRRRDYSGPTPGISVLKPLIQMAAWASVQPEWDGRFDPRDQLSCARTSGGRFWTGGVDGRLRLRDP